VIDVSELTEGINPYSSEPFREIAGLQKMGRDYDGAGLVNVSDPAICGKAPTGIEAAVFEKTECV
jgi:translation initiation factor 6 (eIF-6)